MIIASTSGTIRKKVFDGKIYDYQSEEVAAGLFTATSPVSELSVAVVDGYILTITGTYENGQDILITGSDGVSRDNVVKYASATKIELAERLNNVDDSTVTVAKNYYSIVFSSIPEGLYFFADHEALLINDTFVNIQVDVSAIKARYKNFNNDSLEIYNEEAIKSVLADFSFDATFYRIIDLNQVRELIILKILTFAVASDDKEGALKDYTDFKLIINNKLKLSEGKTIEDKEVVLDPDDDGSGGGITWGLRA